MQIQSSDPRKVFQGVATRHEMYRLFDRHAQRPNRWQDEASALYAGEWFEITEADYRMMLEILPPLWMRGDMFAMREFLTDDVTSVFFVARIDGRTRYFHAYCDLSDPGARERMRKAIIERESYPVKAITRAEQLDHIWSSTHDGYRGYADEHWPHEVRGERIVMCYCGSDRPRSRLLGTLTDDEVAAKLPVQFRHLCEPLAA